MGLIMIKFVKNAQERIRDFLEKALIVSYPNDKYVIGSDLSCEIAEDISIHYGKVKGSTMIINIIVKGYDIPIFGLPLLMIERFPLNAISSIADQCYEIKEG